MAFYTLPYKTDGTCCPTCPTVQSCNCDQATSCLFCSTDTSCNPSTFQPSCHITTLGLTIPFVSTSSGPNTWHYVLTIDSNCQATVDINCVPFVPGFYEVIVSIVGAAGVCPAAGRTTWRKGFSETDNVICCVGGTMTGTATGLTLIQADCFPDIPCWGGGLPFDVDVTFG